MKNNVKILSKNELLYYDRFLERLHNVDYQPHFSPFILRPSKPPLSCTFIYWLSFLPHLLVRFLFLFLADLNLLRSIRWDCHCAQFRLSLMGRIKWDESLPPPRLWIQTASLLYWNFLHDESDLKSRSNANNPPPPSLRS